MSKKGKTTDYCCQIDSILTQNNIDIVDSFKKRSYNKSPEEWNQLKYIILWKAFRDYEPGHGTKFESYLHTKAKFEVMRYNTAYLKESKRLDKVSLEFCQETEYNKTEGFNLITESLPMQAKEILEYKYVQGMSSEEICNLTKISIENYQEIMFDAINKLREEYVKGSLN